jgi:arabinan endo-1,5-alpha-L-arabinosidase
MTKRSGAVKQQPFGVFIQRVGAERGEKHLDFAEPTIAGSLEGMVSFLSIETRVSSATSEEFLHAIVGAVLEMIRRLLLFIIAAGMAFAPVFGQGIPAASTVIHQPHVHDPCIIAAGDYFYVYSTGMKLPFYRSKDLFSWTRCGTVFDSNPVWALAAVPGVVNPWAPDISFFNGSYHLYYSMSTFGSNLSCIGLTTNKTLDPNDPQYSWVDQGEVFKSSPQDDFNAIDPNLIMDENDRPWMVLGSCWGGIRLLQLDPATGKRLQSDTGLYSLATRPQHKLIEAPFIIRHGGYFYLFVSFDACCRGAQSTYKVMVGRSAKIAGPYVDMDRTPMMRGGGSLVIAGQGTVAGPGHNAALTSAFGRDWIVHHFYDATDHGRSKLQIRPMDWDADGWPIAGDPLLAPAKLAAAPDSLDLSGGWRISIDFGMEKTVRFSSGEVIAHHGVVQFPARDGFSAARCCVGDDGSWLAGHDATGRLVRGRADRQ